MRRHLVELEGCRVKREPRAGPVTDELVAIARSAGGRGRGGRLGVAGDTYAAIGTRLGRPGECSGIRETVDSTARCGGPEIPGQQGDILQVIGEASHTSGEGGRCREAVLGIGAGRLEQEVVGADAGAAAAAVLAGLQRRKQPGWEVVAVGSRSAEIGERIVEQVVEEFGELLGEWLDVAVFDDSGSGANIGADDEGVARGSVDPVRPPGAAYGCVGSGVVSGVVSDGDDQCAVLAGNLLE